ncbi:MAG: DUF2182 domain-containing protein [Candidatus Binataceae bacterium]|nr:DUF2182 domain-containing protein [Candidatus Binataceae bacterium]
MVDEAQTAERESSRRRASERASRRAFVAVAALLFAASAAVTIIWCASMSAMRGMPMPGGWTMSMAWMRMPGQTWSAAAAAFLGMWVVMMVAMMLPSVVPMLLRYRQGLRASDPSGVLTALVSAGYALVWTVLGLAVYPVGAIFSVAAMRSAEFSRMAPVWAGLVVLLAGFIQLTPWKAGQLRRCRNVPRCGRSLSSDARGACEHGLRMGLHCIFCCFSYMTILLVTGVMNIGIMALLTVAITAERLAPKPEWAARAAGVVTIASAIFMIARAANT